VNERTGLNGYNQIFYLQMHSEKKEKFKEEITFSLAKI
jgi:hypothetical protein